MAKFCVYCGAPLEQGSNLCPLCEREQPNLSEPKPMIWPSVKQEEVSKPEPENEKINENEDKTEPQPFVYAVRWLKEESPVWQEQKKIEPAKEQLEESPQTPQADKHEDAAPELPAFAEKAQEDAPALEDLPKEEPEDRFSEQPEECESAAAGEAGQAEGKEESLAAQGEQTPSEEAPGQDEGKEQNEEISAPEEKEQPVNVPQEEKTLAHESSEQAQEKTPVQDALTQESSQAEKEQEYEETFSEILQDFSKEQEKEPKPPEPKYIPMATYEEQPELTTAGILGMLVLAVLPVVGWIVMLIWAFDGQVRPFQKRLARAILLFKLVLWLVFGISAALVGYLSYQLLEMSAFSAFAG